jgi:hypothetical protein
LLAVVAAQQVGEPEVSGRKRDPMPFLLLLQQREQQREHWREEVLDVRRDDQLDAGLRLRRLDPVVELRQRDHHARPGVGKWRHQLVLGVDGVQRDDHGAELPDGKLGDGKLRAVGQQQRDAIAAADAERRERGGEGVAERVELTPRDAASLEDQRRGAGPFCDVPVDVVDQRAGRIRLERRRDAGVVVRQPPWGRHVGPM